MFLQANGGRVVQLEKEADFLIVDHMAKEVIPGSYEPTSLQRV